MAIRVAAIGTGNVGRHALTQLITDPRFELTGVWVSSDSKAGKDAGELAGLDVSTGITATTDLDAVLATKPDCVVYTAMADNRLVEALEDYRRILAAGVNVVGSSAVFLQYPWQVLPAEMVAPIEEAAEAGQASLFVNGIDPGFANDLLPLALAGTCQSIEQIRCMEIINYATYDSATVMFDVMGFGKPLDETPDAAAARRAEPGVGFGGATARRRPRRRTRRGHRDLRPRARARGLRHRLGSHRQGHRRRAAVRGARHDGRQGGRRARARHPAARRPATGLAAACPGGRLVPHRNHRRTVVRRSTSA